MQPTNESIDEGVSKAFFGNIGDFSYAIKLNSCDAKSLLKKGFNGEIKVNSCKKNFINSPDVKKTYVDAKGKPTLQAVKEWVKENKPSEFFAKWKKDNALYKDDVIEIFYK